MRKAVIRGWLIGNMLGGFVGGVYLLTTHANNGNLGVGVILLFVCVLSAGVAIGLADQGLW